MILYEHSTNIRVHNEDGTIVWDFDEHKIEFSKSFTLLNIIKKTARGIALSLHIENLLIEIIESTDAESLQFQIIADEPRQLDSVSENILYELKRILNDAISSAYTALVDLSTHSKPEEIKFTHKNSGNNREISINSDIGLDIANEIRRLSEIRNGLSIFIDNAIYEIPPIGSNKILASCSNPVALTIMINSVHTQNYARVYILDSQNKPIKVSGEISLFYSKYFREVFCYSLNADNILNIVATPHEKFSCGEKKIKSYNLEKVISLSPNSLLNYELELDD